MASQSITKAEFLVKYGDVEMKFDSYYKYSFTYVGTAPDGARITAELGGNADDIYKESISASATMPLSRVGAYAGTACVGGTSVLSFYEY